METSGAQRKGFKGPGAPNITEAKAICQCCQSKNKIGDGAGEISTLSGFSRKWGRGQMGRTRK